MVDENATCSFGRNSVVRENGSILVEGRSRWSVGDNVRIMQGCEIEVIRGGHLEIGSNVYAGAYCNIRCCGRVEIGDGVRLSQFVSLIDGNYDIRNKSAEIGDLTAESVKVGSGAWVGAQAVILPRVEVGEGAVVGAGSIVTKSVPAFAVVAGNPARILSYRK
jgi:acetyltransferase-like isoleucine patch superfamily enzyme